MDACVLITIIFPAILDRKLKPADVMQELVAYFLHTDADMIQELVANILNPYIPYSKNQRKFDKKALQLLHRVKSSINFMRTKKIGCPEAALQLQLTSASEISSDESQSPQQAITMSSEDSKSGYMMGEMLPAGRSSPSSPPRRASLQQICTPPPPSPTSSETESPDDPKLPIPCESPRQTSDDEDSKFDDKTIVHKMLPQGEAVIAHGQDSLQQQSCASLSPSKCSDLGSDECKSIKNQLPQQATDNPSNLLSRSRCTLARQDCDSLQQQSCASLSPSENPDLIKKQATHNPSNLLSRSRYTLASLSRPLVYDHEVRLLIAIASYTAMVIANIVKH